MRKLKFRGKRISDGTWVVGSYYYLKDCKFQIYANGIFTPILPETLAEDSGVFDIHGNEIFVGDIVTGMFWFGKEVDGVCEFHDGSYGLKWKRSSNDTIYEFCPFTSMHRIELEIKGNIFDMKSEEEI